MNKNFLYVLFVGLFVAICAIYANSNSDSNKDNRIANDSEAATTSAITTTAPTETTVSEKKGVDFNEVYNRVISEYESLNARRAISVASDGSYLSVDTNPFDVDSDYMDITDSAIYYSVLLKVNEELGLSEATTNRMNHARALDGTQTISDNNINVTYLYHPDHGLEVMYENE